MKVKASRLISRGFTSTLIPDTLSIQDNKVIVEKKTWLGLKNQQKRVTKDQLASVRINNGFFYSTIYLETTGGATEDISVDGIPKRKAKKAVIAIEDMLES
ncbi:hypothetical protein [Halonatronum saccharophilum]|uniref:hypothetical protein n=1 Tax=Halonatronum saccharophilum TaxID=150060 RepID=UPI000483C11A|nr:hypothetical protein [Halonatronum saccharophilum]